VADSGLKKFFKISCVGCLGLTILVVAAVVIFGWFSSRSAEFTDRVARYEPESLVGESIPQGSESAPNRVRLLVTAADRVVLRACEEGESLHVQATYNKKRVEFREELDHEPDGSWTYTVEMEGSGSSLARFIEKAFSRRETELEVCLPADVPIALETEMTRAGMEAELGGLWLSTIDLRADMGGVVVRFDEPLREPAESVSVQVNMGGIVLQGVGHASPAVLEVDYKFGGGLLDLTGDWKRDAQIDMQGKTGGVTVILPDSVLVKGVPDELLTTGSNPETTPTLFFAPGTDFEEVTVRRR